MYSDRLVPSRVRPVPRSVAVPLDTLWTRGALLATLALAAILNFAGSSLGTLYDCASAVG